MTDILTVVLERKRLLLISVPNSTFSIVGFLQLVGRRKVPKFPRKSKNQLNASLNFQIIIK